MHDNTPCGREVKVPRYRGTPVTKRAFLLSELIRRDLAARFAGTFGGWAWIILNPVLLGAIYWLVFAGILRTRPPEGFPGGYAEFLLAGLLPWIGFHEAMTRGAAAVTDQAHLVKKLKFPRELLVVSALGSAVLLEAAALAILAAFAVAVGHARVNLGSLGAAFAFQAVLLAGPILFLAALNVFFRDLPQVLSPALMVLFYLTPIVYPESLVPPIYARWLVANPVRDLVALFRTGLFGVGGPPAWRVAAWTVASIVLAFAGSRFFRRCDRSFADLL